MKLIGLKRARERKGWTQERLAEEVGVSHAVTVARWEAGTRSPDIKTLQLLAEKLGVTISYLLRHKLPPAPGHFNATPAEVAAAATADQPVQAAREGRVA